LQMIVISCHKMFFMYYGLWAAVIAQCTAYAFIRQYKIISNIYNTILNLTGITTFEKTYSFLISLFLSRRITIY